jgi:hypothetical protein
MGEKREGAAMALIITATKADAEYFALHDLAFVTVSATMLVSDSVYVGPSDTKAPPKSW